MQDRVADGVGGARLKFLEPGILAPDPLAGSKAGPFAALLDRRHQIRQERRLFCPSPSSVATMAPRGGAHATAHRGRLARRGGMPELAQIRALLHDRGEPLRVASV